MIEFVSLNSISVNSDQFSKSEDVALAMDLIYSSPDGRLLPTANVVKIAREKGIPVAVDAAQSIGQFPVDIKEIESFINNIPKRVIVVIDEAYAEYAEYQNKYSALNLLRK